MIRIAVSLFAVALSFSSTAARAGEDRDPPPPSISDSRSKPPLCEWVCMEWSDNGGCKRQEYVCR